MALPTLTAFESTSAEARIARVREFLAERGRASDVVVVGPRKDALADVVRAAAHEQGAVFGWQRVTFARLAGTLAAPALATRGLVPIGALGTEALCARLVHRAKGRGELERLAPIAHFPGLPKALARTIEEARLARVDIAMLGDSPDVARLMQPFVDLLAEAKLADRAAVLEAALARAKNPAPHALLDRSTAFFDVAIESQLEAELLEALAARAKGAIITIPRGDEGTLARVRAMTTIERIAPRGAPTAIQEQLFSERADMRAPGEALTMFSAPGENRECVEIARIAKAEAERGTRFDRMAVLLRAPSRYRAHLEEAFRRAAIPAHFARGTARPDASGRALLALLACKLEALSAMRFAEYMSLGEIPRADPLGAPPPAKDAADRWVPPDSDVVADAVSRAAFEEGEDDEGPEEGPVEHGTLRAPRLWEHLIVDAAVIEDKSRWKTRLEGLDRELHADLENARRFAEEKVAGYERSIDALQSLRDFALPLLDELDALPARATWGEWIEALSVLASRALRKPTRVQAALAELEPMAEVGPIDLREVRLVLEQRLTDVIDPPSGSRYGKLFIATPDEARGMDFDVVFVPGLAEKMFPQKVIEDPILPDAARANAPLRKNEERSAGERLALRLAVGAASRRIVASYPRLDVDQARPRTPSFYALELIRAAEGTLPGFDDLARRASSASVAHWLARSARCEGRDRRRRVRPRDPRAHLAAARARDGGRRALLARRESAPRTRPSIPRGALEQPPLVQEPMASFIRPPPRTSALKKHDISARSFSPTALQNFASCPYRFLLQAVHRLAPREEPAPLEDIDPLQRGSIMHEAQFETLVALRAENLLPVTMSNMSAARTVLDRATAGVASRYMDDSKPAIPRVWEDGIARIRADLAEWLRRMATEDDERVWTPAHFELSFGLAKERREQQDPRSSEEPVALDCGIKLRGSIDLVERRARDGWLRATDHKRARCARTRATVIGGGEDAPAGALRARDREIVRPGSTVWGGRLYYCTSAGDYTSVPIPLDAGAREDAKLVAETVHDAIDRGFLPAAPAKGECQWCDYARVCGPYEESRVAKKPAKDIVPLQRLRERA